MAKKSPSFFHNISFWLLLVGQFISNLGLICAYVTISWITYRLTNSTLAVGQILFTFSIAQLFGRLFSGSLVDRLDLRKIMVATDLLTGFFLFLLLLLLASQHFQLWQLYLTVALIGYTQALFQLASFSLLPELVHSTELEQTNALMMGSQELTSTLGTAMAGGIIDIFGSKIALLTVASAFILSAISEFGIRFRRQVTRIPYTSWLQGLRTGFNFYTQQPALLWLTILVAITGIGEAAVQAVMLPFLERELDASATEFGLVLSAFSIGAVVSALTIGLLRKTKKRQQFIVGGLLLNGLAIILLALAPNLSWVLVTAFCRGFAFSLVNILSTVIYQQLIPVEFRGRVFAVRLVLEEGFLPVGFFAGGALGEAISLRYLLLATGLLICFSAISSLFITSLRHINTLSNIEQEELPLNEK